MTVKPKYFHYMISSDIEQSMRDGEASIDFKPETNVPIAHRMLTFPWRGFVIQKVKAPLQRAIKNSNTLLQLAPVLLRSVKRLKDIFGEATKQNAIRPVALCLIEHKARFLSYENNPGRASLFGATYEIGITEVASDLYYEDRLNAEIEWIIEDILDGKWEPRCEGQPHQFWNEPAPYGGKYSIVFKLQKHREEILKIIGGCR